MKILVVGGGGREHALVWKLASDAASPALYCAPGNAGTAQHGTNLPLAADDVPGILAWAKAERPDLTVIGPEAPLCAGLTDVLMAEGLRVFGPNRAAAQLEGSKIFAKEVMEASGVPTARSATFTDPESAKAYVRAEGAPIVIKAEGLAAGKGVTVCASVAEAESAIDVAMCVKAFGAAGERILVEECLDGPEASILALVDGEHCVLLASSQDHKRALEGDRGPNTGGMGAYSPAPVVTDALWPVIKEQVFARTLQGLQARGITFKGVLYAGLMLTPDGPKVLEFNTRFGDPETQVILPRLDVDLVPLFEACIDGTLCESMLAWKPDACVTVVMAAKGYPGSYPKGDAITGLDGAGAMEGVVVFHAGTQLAGDRVLTAGGRVLGVTALGPQLEDAIMRAYAGIDRIGFAGGWCRRDIAAKATRSNEVF
ncbi:MAG: phosphoribosylamine--glycine ligase [Kiritimatiellia bacterium]